MKSRFAGVTATDLYVTVHAEVTEGAWTRYCTVRVPLAALLHPEITDAMDRCVRRRLAEVWQEAPDDEPLPGMP